MWARRKTNAISAAKLPVGLAISVRKGGALRAFFIVFALAFGSSALGQTFSVRAEGGGAMAVGAPQNQYFGLGLQGVLTGSMSLVTFLDVQLQGGYLRLPPKPGGGLTEAGTGLFGGASFRVKRPMFSSLISPWLEGGAQFFRTGELNRASITGGAGVLFRWSADVPFWVGLYGRYIQVLGLDQAAGFTTADAKLLTFGLSVEFTPGLAKHARREKGMDDTVVEVDECPDGDPKCGGKDTDGDGVPDDVDACRREPGTLANNGCPAKDEDGDGISGPDDKCPLEPEDKDNFEDQDGCPDPDNDRDGVPDVRDACPNSSGSVKARGCPDTDGDNIANKFDACPDKPGVAEFNGCPKYSRTTVTDSKLETSAAVAFTPMKAKVAASSNALLNEIALVMTDRKRICVRVEVHTEAMPNKKASLKLSQDRANEVKKYLVGKGVAANRLEAKGEGEAQPPDKAKKGRVEFLIVECGGGE